MKIALTLSGGGARCLAQLGYIDLLQELSIQIEAISGSSGGAIIGAFLANGYTPKEILEIIQMFPFSKIKLNLFKGTLFSLEPIIGELEKFGLKSFDELKIPFFATVTGYDDSQTYYLNSGNLARSIIASSALIPIFAPVAIDQKLFVDGGFSDNLPIYPLKEHPFILAINVNPTDVHHFPQTFWGNIKRASYILLNTNIKHSKTRASKYVEIKECGKFGILDRKNIQTIYEIGQQKALQEIKEWEKLCLKH